MNSLRVQPGHDSAGIRESSVRTKVTIEAIGTFVLMATAGVAIFSACPLASLGVGMVLMVSIYAAGHLTGGHFNAAVTLAVLLRRKLGLRAATMHWLAQVSGGLVAAVVVRAIVHPDRVAAKTGLPLDKPTIAAAFVAELVFAFVLSYVTLGLAGDPSSPSSAHDLAVGVSAIVGALGVAALATGSFHAATVFHDMTTDLVSWSTVWVYLVGQIVAGLFAGITFVTFGWWAHLEN